MCVLSKEYLESQPEEVARLLIAAGPILHHAPEDRVLPIEVNLGVFVEIPVETKVGHIKGVGPEIGIGQATRENVRAQFERAEAPYQLPGTRPHLAGAEVERFERLDRPATLQCLARQEVA